MTLRFFYSPAACSLAPHIVLEETGAAYEPVRVTLAEGQQYSDDYRRINPRCKVPALQLGDGQVLTETHAIMAYLADTHPDKGLIPTDPLGRARAHEWMNHLAGGVHPHFTRFFRPERFVTEGADPAPVREAGLAAFRSALGEVEGRLPEDGFALGAYSVVDAHLTVFLRWGGRAGFDLETEFPRYLALVRRVQQRPATQRALAMEDLPLL